MALLEPKFEKIEKRNGELENFNYDKLILSIANSLRDVELEEPKKDNKILASQLANDAVLILNDKKEDDGDYLPSVFDLREATQLALMKNNQFKAAQAYITHKQNPKFVLKIQKGIQRVVKRGGGIVDFNLEKIKQAILKAGEFKNAFGETVADELANNVYERLNKIYDQVVPNIEQIQDIVEMEIMKAGYVEVARDYIVYRIEHRKLRDKQLEILGGKTTNIKFSENALRVLAKRYLVRDEDDNIVESPEEMFSRVAKTISQVEKDYGRDEVFIKDLENKFYQIMHNFEFTPAGRTLANAGAPTRLVSNCIVLHIEDNMKSIFETLRDAALLQQAGSGLGFPMHRLRPAGSIAKATRGVASGPISFLKVYNKAFGVIKQQNRHGANMGVMRVDHPDILEFIHCKEKEGELRNFNLSVGLTNEFMQKVKDNDPHPWICRFKNEETKPRRVIRDEHDVIQEIREETLSARELFQEIINAAWQNGEPGCVFLDRVNETNPLPGLGTIEACNPCGEQFLHDGDVCNLGSINLAKFVKDEAVDYDKLKEVTELAIRMLDNVIDLTDFPVERVSTVFKANRRIGLGIMGFGDMLYQLKVGYNSEEGRNIAEKMMSFINKTAHEMSEKLASEKGVFPNFDKSIYASLGKKMRNAALTTIAPTGTTSMLFNCSSGVEPYFALAYYYKGILGSNDTELYYANQYLEDALRSVNLYNKDILQKIEEAGSVQGIEEIPEQMRKVFVASMDISADDHIKMQAAFQKHVDNSISKTVNFPNSATKNDVMQGYILAWELGCKGCTVYRDGSRDIQVLNLNNKADKNKEVEEIIEEENEVKKYNFNSGNKKEVIKKGICPECGSKIEVNEGCYVCRNCGFSACSL